MKLNINNMHEGAKSAFVYTFSTVFSRGLAIITVPIFTRLMTTEQIGIVNLYNSWYSLISVIATLSLTSGGFAVAMKEFKDERDQYLSSVLSLTSAIGLLIGIIFMAFSSYWIKVTGLSRSLLILMAIGFIVAPARDFWLARQRYEYKYKLAGSITIFSAVAASAISIFAVNYAKNHGVTESIKVAEFRLFSNYLIIYGIAAFIWVFLFIKGKTLYNSKYWKLSLSLSLPLVGYAVASQILSVSDRMMISKMVNDSAVGIYSTLYTVSSLSLMVWTAINASFVPYLYQNISVNDKRVKEISFELLALYSFVAVAMVYLAPEIVRILATEEYFEAIYIMPPIAGGVYFISVSNMYSNVLIYLKKTKYIMISASIAAALNLVTNYIFINKYGYMAAAYTTLFAYIVMSILLVYFSNRCADRAGLNISSFYANRLILILSVVTTALCLLGLMLYKYNILRYISIILVILSGIAIAYYLQKKRNILSSLKGKNK